jgi:hypothetical protein
MTRAVDEHSTPMSSLILKHASASRRSGEWSDDDYDVLADGLVVGRIIKAAALWTLAYGQHKDRTPTQRPPRTGRP